MLQEIHIQRNDGVIMQSAAKYTDMQKMYYPSPASWDISPQVCV